MSDSIKLSRFVHTLVEEVFMLKILALAACVIGFVFLGPKALAEYRRALPRTRTRLKESAEKKPADDKQNPVIAA